MKPEDLDYLLSPTPEISEGEPGAWNGPDPTDSYTPVLEPLPQLTRELAAVANYLGPDKGGLGVAKHFRNACNLAFSEKAFRRNRWSDHRAMNMWMSPFTCWWGPAASAKTTDAARNALMYWLAAPHRTYVCCCSTTADQLDKRVWGEIKRLYSDLCAHHPQIRETTRLLSTKREIQFRGQSDEGEDTKNCIRGVAIREGSLEDAIGNVIGTHNDRVGLLVDEAQVSRDALIEARVNLRKGTEHFWLLLIGNPTFQNDPLGKYSRPLKGYRSLTISREPYTYESEKERMLWELEHEQASPEDMEFLRTVMVPKPDTERWRSPHGNVFFYNGFNAPSMDSLEEMRRLHFLLQRSELHDDLDEYGPDHPRFWTMGLGWVPPEVISNNVFSFPLFEEGKAQAGLPVWRNDPFTILSVDPAFSAGGDEYIMKRVDVGHSMDGKLQLYYHPAHSLELRDTHGAPLEDYAAVFVAQYMFRHGIEPEYVIYDTTGNQTVHPRLVEKYYGVMHQHRDLRTHAFEYVWDTLSTLDSHSFDGAIYRFNGSSKPEPWVLTVRDSRLGTDEYRNKRAQAHYTYRDLLRNDHIRGVPDNVVNDLCDIRLKFDPEKPTEKLLLESKAELKGRIGHSPDEADADVLASYLVRARFGMTPGDHNTLDVPENEVDELDFLPDHATLEMSFTSNESAGYFTS